MSSTSHAQKLLILTALLPLSACMIHSRSYIALEGPNIRPQGEICRAGAPANHYIPNGAVEFRVNLEPQTQTGKRARLNLYVPTQELLDISALDLVFTPDKGTAIKATFNKVNTVPYEKAYYEELPRKFAPRTMTVHYFVADTYMELGEQGSMLIPSIKLSSLQTDQIIVRYRRANYSGVMPLNC